MTNKKGFTLIELLIVIAIIGILAAALIPNIVGAPASARDTQRITDTNSIVTALEQYYAANGKYPAANGCLSDLSLGSYFKGGNTPSPNIAGRIVTTTPACTNDYVYCKLNGTSGLNYAILAPMEKAGSGNNYADDDANNATALANCGNAATGPAVEATAGGSYVYMIKS